MGSGVSGISIGRYHSHTAGNRNHSCIIPGDFRKENLIILQVFSFYEAYVSVRKNQVSVGILHLICFLKGTFNKWLIVSFYNFCNNRIYRFYEKNKERQYIYGEEPYYG